MSRSNLKLIDDPFGFSNGRKIKLFEENGKFFISDELELNLIKFKTKRERNDWLSDHRLAAVGFAAMVANPPDDEETEDD